MIPSPRSAIAYRPDIDGLRAVAVLAVVGFHAFPGYFPGGFLGVDIFFVISGYLITTLLLRERERSGTIDIAAFYVRRIRRLFPALLLVIVATLIAGYFLLFAHEFSRLARHAWASLFFAENILLASESGYFDVDAYAKPLLHFWSLAVEEQFYVVWPFLLAFAARTRRQVALAIALAALASLAITFSQVLTGAWHFYSPLTRVWELGAGAALAWWSQARDGGLPRASAGAAGVLSLAGLGSIAWSILLGSESWQHPGLLTLAPVLGTMLLIAAGRKAWPNARLLALRPAAGVGLISYPLYLWHWPLLSYLSIISADGRGSFSMRVAMVALAIALAAVTYRFVERPFRAAVPARCALAGLVALALAIGVAQSGRPAARDRMAAIAEEQIEGADWQYRANALCREAHARDAPAFCMQNRPGRPDVLLFGNSYANQLYPGLARHPALAQSTIVNLGACEVSGAAAGIEDDCEAQWDLLRTMPHGALVLVANQWLLFSEGAATAPDPEGSARSAPGDPDFGNYATGLSQNIARLGASGKTIVLVGPKAELGYDIADCYARPLRPARQDCLANAARYKRKTARTVALLTRLAGRYANVHFFDLAAVFCSATVCNYRTAEGYPLLRDSSGHLSVLGSDLVASEFMQWAAREGIALP